MRLIQQLLMQLFGLESERAARIELIRRSYLCFTILYMVFILLQSLSLGIQISITNIEISNKQLKDYLPAIREYLDILSFILQAVILIAILIIQFRVT